MSKPAAADRDPLRRVAANAGWLASGEIVGRLVTLLAVVQLSRTLLPSGMGIIDIGMSLHVLGTAVARGGFEVLAARRLARSPRRARELGGLSLFVGWIYVGGFLILALLGWVVVHGATLDAATWVIAAFAGAPLLGPLGFRFAYWGRERMALPAVSNAISLCLYLALAVALVHDASDLWIVGPCWLLVEASRVAPQALGFMRWYGPVELPSKFRRVVLWTRASLSQTLARAQRALFMWSDVLLLGLLATPTEVGIYTAATRFPRLLGTLCGFLGSSSFPPLVRAVSAGRASEVKALHGSVLRFGLGLVAPVVAALVLLAEPIVTLVFGSAFAGAGTLLEVVAWRALLIAGTTVQHNVLLAVQPASDLRALSVGLGMLAVASLVAIPRLGALGAGIAVLLAEGTLLVAYSFVVRRHVSLWGALRAGWLLRSALGVAVVWGAARAAAGAEPLVSVGVTVGAMGAVCAATLLLDRVGLVGSARSAGVD